MTHPASSTISSAMIGGQLARRGQNLPSGEEGVAELRLDLAQFRQDAGQDGNDKTHRVLHAYEQAITQLLGLNPGAAICSNGLDYLPGKRSDGFRVSDELVAMFHLVLIPFAPGGHLRATLRLSVEQGRADIEYRCEQDRFAWDSTGILGNDELPGDRQRNETCAEVLHDFIHDSLQVAFIQ